MKPTARPDAVRPPVPEATGHAPSGHSPADRAPVGRTPAAPAPGAPPGPPRRWKLWLAMICSIYPVILGVETAGEPVLRDLAPAVQFAFVVPVMVAVMVWVVLPQLHRRLGVWMAR